MGGIDRDGRHHGKDMAEETLIEPGPLLLGEVRAIGRANAVLCEFVAQLQPARILLGHELESEFAHLIELLGRRQPVLAQLGELGAHLADETGDPHHEEFLQHPHVEDEPGHFALDETPGISESGRGLRFYRKGNFIHRANPAGALSVPILTFASCHR